MKKFMSLLLSVIIVIAGPAMTSYAAPEWPADTGIQSEAGIVMDVDSKTVMFGQNINVQRAPASITKLLTALVVVEHASLDEKVTFSEEAFNITEDGVGNKNAMAAGDVMTVKDCLYHMLLTSSNQTANALAEHVGGSLEDFTRMMNEKAEELGCRNSHFANPSGLNDDTQLTTPYDMALIGIAAYDNPTLLEINSSKSYRLPKTINNPEGVTIRMEHRMMQESREEYYPAVVAGKTGFTSIAGQTLVTYAVKDGRRLIAVTMKSNDFTHYIDTKALLDFGFDRFENIKISENETSYTSGTEPVVLGENSYSPSDLSIDSNAVITIPRAAGFADAKKSVETKLPDNHPKGAVALLSYTYPDQSQGERKVGSAYIISASKAAEEAKTAGDGSSELEKPDQEGEEKPGTEKEGTALPVSFKLPKQAPWIALAAVAVAAALGFAVVMIRKKREEERILLEERRKKRRQRLEEIGCTQEDFDRLLEERSRRGK